MASYNDVKGCVWMIADRSLYFSDVKPRGSMTAHMQMQELLAKACNWKKNGPHWKIECAGGVRPNGVLHGNSLFNNKKFNTIMTQSYTQDADSEDDENSNAKEKRDRIKKETPDTPCTKAQLDKFAKLYEKGAPWTKKILHDDDPSDVSCQPSAVSRQPSAVSSQQVRKSASQQVSQQVSSQPSFVSRQPSAVNIQQVSKSASQQSLEEESI